MKVARLLWLLVVIKDRFLGRGGSRLIIKPNKQISDEARKQVGFVGLSSRLGRMKTRTKDYGDGGGGGIFHIPPVLRFHGDRFHNTVTLEGVRFDMSAFSDKVVAAQKEIK